jgi:hypothetical protein
MKHLNAALAIPLQERVPTSRHRVTGIAYDTRKPIKPQSLVYIAGTKLILKVSRGEHARGRGNIAEALPNVSASSLVRR